MTATTEGSGRVAMECPSTAKAQVSGVAQRIDLDLFCCAGGATTGISLLGRSVVGIDHDADACATHLAAGHPTIRADLTRPVPVSFQPELLWASPPCTAFSMAGKGEGRDAADALVSRILAENWEPMGGHDPTVWLILPTMRAVLAANPVAIAMENVPPTMPVMQACAQVLERHGYRTAVGVLSAECFGVAQTRKRAFLIANRTRSVAMPEPTHQAYGSDVDEAQGSLFGEPLLPWISMAQALGWEEHWGTGQETARGAGMTERHGTRPIRPAVAPSEVISSKTRSWERVPVAMDRRCQQGPKDARESVPPVPVTSPSPSLTSSGVSGQFVWKLQGNNTIAGGPLAERDADEPAMTVGSRADLWKLRADAQDNATVRDAKQPAPTVRFGHDSKAWTWERPSTTLVSSFRPDVVAGPGYRQAGDGPRQDAPGSISISISEAARLQAFPNSHPWQGSRTSIFRQIGNAVPPPVAAAVAGAALGVDWRPAVAAYLTELYAEPLAREEAA